jgi:hypothetical protein
MMGSRFREKVGYARVEAPAVPAPDVLGLGRDEGNPLSSAWRPQLMVRGAVLQRDGGLVTQRS